MKKEMFFNNHHTYRNELIILFFVFLPMCGICNKLYAVSGSWLVVPYFVVGLLSFCAIVYFMTEVDIHPSALFDAGVIFCAAMGIAEVSGWLPDISVVMQEASALESSVHFRAYCAAFFVGTIATVVYIHLTPDEEGEMPDIPTGAKFEAFKRNWIQKHPKGGA